MRRAFRFYHRRANILVCGYNGAGKSSLINAILGDDVVPPDAIGSGVPKTMGFDRYPKVPSPTELVCVFDSKGMELGEEEEAFVETTRRFVKEKQSNPDIDEHIHIVWYAIQGPGARVTDCDLRLIKTIFNPDEVIVVITKADITRPSQQEAMKKMLVAFGVSPDRIVFTSDREGGSIGCSELMRKTYEMLPDAYRDAFMAKQEVDKEAKKLAVEEKNEKAKAIIVAATVAATAAAATPLPFSDVAIIVPVQSAMIASLAGLYGVSIEQIKAQILPFLATLTGLFLTGSLVKFIPFLGSLAGGLINGTVAATITGGMGLYAQSLFKESALAKIENRPPPKMELSREAFERFRKKYVKTMNS